jgi:hypothetical protein
LDCTGTYDLKFLPWIPYGFLHDAPAEGDEDCKNNNDSYSTYANANPYFWGWAPFESLVTTVVSSAYSAGVSIREFEIDQEQNFVSFPVVGRLIYDNKHYDGGTLGYNVLSKVRGILSTYSYNSGLATYSMIPQFPDADTGYNNANGVDCGSYWGDSAMLLETSALTGAIAGPYGEFGWPASTTTTHLLSCGGTDGGMASLPVYSTQPTVVDVHAYPCINNTGDFSNCSTSDATNTAETFYSDVWGFLSYRSLTSATAIFGESSIIDFSGSTGGLPPSDTGASWAVNGYMDSSLYSNHASSTVFQPFNNICLSNYANPINVASSPYNPY